MSKLRLVDYSVQAQSAPSWCRGAIAILRLSDYLPGSFSSFRNSKSQPFSGASGIAQYLTMADPVSIAGLALQVVQILAPVVQALHKAYRDGKTIHQTLHELHSDLDALYELTENIRRLFNVSRFIDTVREVQRGFNMDLVGSLEHALESCSKGAQMLCDILVKLVLQPKDSVYKQAKLQWRLDRRLDDIDRLKRNFQDHKSSIQLAFQLLAT